MSVHKARSMLYTWTYNSYMPGQLPTHTRSPQVILIVRDPLR
jgi:hypothetical protein